METEHDWLEVPEAVFDEIHASDTAEVIEEMKAQRAHARPVREQQLSLLRRYVKPGQVH